MGSGQTFFDLGRAIFLLLWSGHVSYLWIWKIFPKNPKFFNFFPLGQKNFPKNPKIFNFSPQDQKKFSSKSQKFQFFPLGLKKISSGWVKNTWV